MAEKCLACGQDLPVVEVPVDLARTPKILEGDETPAGYLGYDGPKAEEPAKEEGPGVTKLDTYPELPREEVLRRRSQRGR